MSTHLYFAYGSNLLSTRLLARCPSARVVGRARAAGHSVAFAKYSWMDNSGKATLMAVGAGVEGVVYTLAPDDMVVLDAIEGVGKGYDRHDGFEVMGAERYTCATYIATDPKSGQRPFDWYLALILAGAAEHGLDVGDLRQAAYDADPDPTRDGRLKAVAALQAAGYHDWQGLLVRPR